MDNVSVIMKQLLQIQIVYCVYLAAHVSLRRFEKTVILSGR